MAQSLGYRVTVVSVLSRIKDSVNLLRMTLKRTAEFDVDHVAVKNLFFGKKERFLLFEGSKTKELLLDGGGVELFMPELFDDTYELLDQANLPFRVAVTAESGLLAAQRSRIFKWQKALKAEVMAAGEVLGV